MSSARFSVGLLSLAMFAGCASSGDPRIKQEGDGCNPGNVGQVNSLGELVFAFTFDLAFAYSCEGITHLVEGGHPPSRLKDGVYLAGNRTFSIKLPVLPSSSKTGAYSLFERLTRSEDHIFILPNTMGEGLSAYMVDVIPKLDPVDQDASPKGFLGDMTRVKQLMKLHAVTSEDGPPLLHEESITLDGKPALFQAYSVSLKADDDDKDNDGVEFFGSSNPTLYMLLYVVKTGDQAAILGIARPSACPKCATGPEAEVRAMDPALQAFVSSFHMAAPGTKLSVPEDQEVHQQSVDEEQR